jgi:protein CpxP
MKHWIKRTLIGMVGATLVIGSLSACSGHPGHHGWNMSAEDQAKFKTKMVDRVGSKLDLNADQKKRLSAVADQLQAQRVALMGKTTDPSADLQALIAGPKFDVEKAQGLINDKANALNSKSPALVAALGDFYDHLTPEQQTKVRDLLGKSKSWGRRG